MGVSERERRGGGGGGEEEMEGARGNRQTDRQSQRQRKISVRLEFVVQNKTLLLLDCFDQI